MTDQPVLVLVFDPGLRVELADLARRLPWSATRQIAFEDGGPDLVLSISSARAASERLPIGVVVADESSGLLALAAGADEAVVLARPNPGALTAFVDRLEVRAQQRRERTMLHESVSQAARLTTLGTLVASVGHEINNPLTALTLSVEVARRLLVPALPDPEVARAAGSLFDDVAGAADAIATIVRDLRVLSRGDRNDPVELVEVPVLVDQALRLVSRELSHAVVERDYAEVVPRLVVPRNRVAQVLVNLLVNAAQATRDVPGGPPRVRVGVRADDEFVAITVTDTGQGIRADHLGRVFDAFFTTKHDRGTGLGLSISRSIVRSLGGELSVESVYGDGATFLCLLPLPTPESAALAARQTEILPSPHRGRSLTVLVVEADERVLRSYARLLHPAHRVLTARDTSDAMDALESGFSPDVVLLELDLPERSGVEFLRLLGARDPALLQRVLLVTSAATRDEYAEVLATYRGPVLEKPVRGELLLAAMERLPWA